MMLAETGSLFEHCGLLTGLALETQSRRRAAIQLPTAGGANLALPEIS